MTVLAAEPRAQPTPARSRFAEVKPRLLSVARTPVGRLVLVGGFTIVIAGLQMPYWWLIGLFLAATSVLPQLRKQILIVAALAWVVVSPPVDMRLLTTLAELRGADQYVKFWPIAPVLCWLFAFGYLALVRAYPKAPLLRRPVMTLIGCFVALLCAAQVPLTGLPWLLVTATTMALGSYLWFFAYWISENASADKAKPVTRTFAWRPFWGFTSVPYGKGAAYLEKLEAKDDKQLAASQLAGLKLLGLAVCWTIVLVALNRGLYGNNGSLTRVPLYAPDAVIPTYKMMLDATNAGTPYPLHVRWVGLVLHFVMWVCGFTVFGHKVIAVARMAGFNLFRNTYKPFLATSIAEFYNRVYFYFKELLVTFFFFPTYLRYFKRHPRLRLFVATLAAAGLGNWLFHFLRDTSLVFRIGLIETLERYVSYALYALILGVAIGVSQLRLLANKNKPPTGARRAIGMAVMLIFYTLICVFEEPNTQHGLRDYGRFFMSLFRM